MKSSEQLKKELHEYIDRIDDDETLWMVHEDVLEYFKNEEVIGNPEKEDLTEEEISEIKTGLDQIKNRETVEWDEYLKATSRWHTP